MFGHPRDEDPEQYRPYSQYGSITMARHAQSQNYNSLQVTANRQVGRINFTGAYTFAKTLGVGGNTYGTTTDQFDARHRSYGVLPYDRTHALSVAYNVLLPGKFTNKMAKGMFEGWQVSGISQWQSGAPLTQFSFGGSMAEPDPENPGQFMSFDWRNTTGTPDTPPRPLLLCDPRKGVGPNQYANPACFAAPTLHTNGSYALPYMKGPAFQNHDVSLFKNFEFNESRKLQFRWSLYNFVNHPLWYFEPSDVALDMNFEQGVPNQASMENFGKVHMKRGRRLMQFALKFYF
jgi:hypothetical protein